MPAPYFQSPPVTLLPEDQQQWRQRIHQAEQLVGLTEAGQLQVSGETLALFQRYVLGELTLEQLVRLQCQRLQIR